MKNNNQKIISSLNLSQNEFHDTPVTYASRKGFNIACYILKNIIDISRYENKDAIDAFSFAYNYTNDFFQIHQDDLLRIVETKTIKDILKTLKSRIGYPLKPEKTMLQYLCLCAKELDYSETDRLQMITNALRYFTLARRAYRIYRQAQSLDSKDKKMTHSRISDMMSYCADMTIIYAKYPNINKHLIQYDNYMYGPITDSLKKIGVVKHCIRMPTPKKSSAKTTHRVKADNVPVKTNRRIQSFEEGNKKNMNSLIKNKLIYKQEKANYAFILKVQIPGIALHKDEIKITFNKSTNHNTNSYVRLDIYKGNDFVEKGYDTISVPFGFVYKKCVINNGILQIDFTKEIIKEYEKIDIF